MSLRNLLLAGVLGLLGPGSVMSAAAEALAPPPTWVVDPATPGANLPLAGRSLFDQLFAVDRNGKAAIELPFPFPALLARLDAQLAQDPASPVSAKLASRSASCRRVRIWSAPRSAASSASANRRKAGITLPSISA